MRSLFSPSVRGRADEGGRGSFTQHLELGKHTTSLISQLCYIPKICVYQSLMYARLFLEEKIVTP